MVILQKSMFFIFFSFFSIFIFGDAQPGTYIYPVAQGMRNGVSVVYLMHQSASNTVRLLVWDPLTKEIQSVLPSLCVPAGLKMLPHETGFSFIDQGLIKVQSFLKRSPKTIEVCDPIYNITTLEWLSDTVCYLSAKETERFGIFQISINGVVRHILKSADAHYRYPQKIENQLFFIEESREGFQVKVTEYPPVTNDVIVTGDEIDTIDVQLVSHQKYRQLLTNESDAQLICHFGPQPIAFLRMTSHDEGFFIAYPPKVSMDDTVLTCTYYHLHKNTYTQAWESNSLFMFHIPLDLIRMTSSVRLYESILPLLPRHFGNSIWYVSQYDVISSPPTLDIFKYDLLHNVSSRLTTAQSGQIFFAPFLCGEQMIYGFSGVEVDVGMVDMPNLVP